MTSSPHFSRGARLSGTVVLAATVAVVLALSGGEASAGHVNCGDTITVDTALDSDLVDCPNNGIVIGADDLTLDLNGHTIDGDERAAPRSSAMPSMSTASAAGESRA